MIFFKCISTNFFCILITFSLSFNRDQVKGTTDSQVKGTTGSLLTQSFSVDSKNSCSKKILRARRNMPMIV